MREFRIAPPKAEVEVDDELGFHVEQRVLDYIARDWFQDLGQDVRFGMRAALRAPLFSLLAIVTLALGIGANAAVFGVVKSVLLDALPYTDADRLVRIYSHWSNAPGEAQSVSPGVATDLATRLRSFSSVAPFNFSTFDVAYLDQSGPRVLTCALVDGGFFQTLGVRAAVGRALTARDAGNATAMLSDAAWRREFGGDPSVIGRTLRIDGNPTEVVGVLPRGFVGPMGDADVWFALDLVPMLKTPSTARGQHWLGAVARLSPGVTPNAAQRELDRLAADLAREYPETDVGRTFAAVPLRAAMVGDTRTPLLVLFASAGLVLVITCANLAGALLARTISRRKEFAVRVALGAGRGRLVRQLLTESMVIALAGAVIGLILAVAGLAALKRMALLDLPPYADLSLDAGAVLVTFVAALCTGCAFGLAPALAAGRWQPQGTLREETRGTSESVRSRQLRGLLVAAQIAVSLSLLVGAGLLARSLWAMTTAPLGFNPANILTGRVQLPTATFTTPEARALAFRQLEERIASLPGVTSVATTTQIASPTMSSNVLTIDGVTLPGDGPTFIPYMSVSDSYFRTLGVALRQGRTFGPADTPNAPPAIVISEAMAHRYWPRGGAIGARMHISPHTSERWGVIVGIVGDTRVSPTLAMPDPMAYASNRQDFAWSGRDVLVKTSGNPLALLRPVQREIAALDPAVPFRDPKTLQAIVDERLAGRRFPVLLMSAFGVLALVLVSVGVYAMFASMAAAREREFGVRLALGSTRGAIAALVLRQGAVWMVLGLAGGVVGVVFVARFVRTMLYAVAPFDPIALALGLAVLVVCGAVALLVPVRRATRVDPITVLR